MESKDDRVFEGLNVILVGDFHQFPPVVGRQTAPLYWPVNQRRDTEDDILGWKMHEQFTMVIQLNKQNKVQDDIWQDILQHVHHGNCHAEHADIIRKLIITNPKCPHTNYDSAPWKDAKLVTPRHGICTLWNLAAVQKHCAENQQQLYVCPCEDSIDGQPASNAKKIAIITRGQSGQNQMACAGLAKEIELAIGAPVMVTMNIHTDLDVANGVWGRIQAIVLDKRERLITTKDKHFIQLKYPPRYVLVRLDQMKAPLLQGLEENVIPVISVTKTFVIKDGIKKTVHRTQLPLILAYAFTDHQSQGQTLDSVIVDIGPPPHGHLTPFNVYVLLSRRTGHQNIQLLWDFDSSLLEQHPSEYLRLEDEHLKELNDSTRQMWRRHVKNVWTYIK
jgi:hypothetical protein